MSILTNMSVIRYNTSNKYPKTVGGRKALMNHPFGVFARRGELKKLIAVSY